MTNEEMFKVLRPIVLKVTGITECIMADQNQIAPKNIPYATIRPRQSVTERGQANIYGKNLTGDRMQTDVRAQVIATCSVNFFRGDAQLYAERMKECHKRPDVMIDLFRAKVGWGGTDAVNNLTALQAANWEQRAQINIRLMYEVNDISEINAITSASISLYNEQDRLLQSINVP